MGTGWRRFTEGVRQTTGMAGKDFQPTSNLRCSTMMKEAVLFEKHLKNCEKAIETMKKSSELILSTTKTVMLAPLPHVFEETAAGSGADVKPMSSIGGPSFHAETVAQLSQTSSAQLESQVLVPIKRWMDVCSELKDRLKEVEALRLEVDSRRHTVLDLASQVDKKRSKLSAGGDSKLESQVEDIVKKLHHKEGKLQLTLQNYQEKETALYADLATLIKDATWLRHYMASALRIQGEALSGAAAALGDGSTETAEALSSLSLGQGKRTSDGTKDEVSSTSEIRPGPMQSAGAPNPFVE